MEIKVGEPSTPPPNLPSPTPFPTPTNVVLPSFAERGEDVDVGDDGRASFDGGAKEPQRPTPVSGQSIWNLFSPVKETPAEKRRDSAMSLATPNNDDMSLASPEKPVAARHVSEPPDTPKEPRETEASKMSFLSVFSFGGSPTSQDAPTPIKPAADEVVEIKVEAAPEPAVEVKKEEPKPAPAKACCVVC